MYVYDAGGTDSVDVFAKKDWKDFADLFLEFDICQDSKVIVSYRFNWAGDPVLVATRLMLILTIDGKEEIEINDKATSCASQHPDIICGSISSVWMGNLKPAYYPAHYKIKVQYKKGSEKIPDGNIINYPSTVDENNPYKYDNHTRVLQVMVMP